MPKRAERTGRDSPTIRGAVSEAVARAARERSEPERETPPLTARRSLPIGACSNVSVARRVRERNMEPTATVEAEQDDASAQDHILEELLVEEISIDGMCGVY